MSKTSTWPPSFNDLLTAAARFQAIVPGSVLVGGCAAVYYAGHRLSSDAELWKGDLTAVFQETADELKSRASWKTKWVRQPTSILGYLDGMKASVWQLSRKEPLETVTVEHEGMKLVRKSEEETITRLIKCRNLLPCFESELW
jgi:hypothetical protein